MTLRRTTAPGKTTRAAANLAAAPVLTCSRAYGTVTVIGVVAAEVPHAFTATTLRV